MTNEWGLRPVLFELFGFEVQSYPFFIALALFVGLGIYLFQLKKEGIRNSNALYIVIFALVGGTLGAKLPMIIMYWDEINMKTTDITTILAGRTIVGGLIGGFLSTYLAKKLFHIEERLGNQIAIPVVVSMAIGRIGCVLRGCCYGKPTYLPIGIDLGDGILRHPTQIYEMIFDLLLAGYLVIRKKKGVEPGELFRIFLNSYLGFRFLIEFIRVEEISILFLTDFQVLCLVSLIFINRQKLIKLIKGEEVKNYE